MHNMWKKIQRKWKFKNPFEITRKINILSFIRVVIGLIYVNFLIVGKNLQL